MKFLLNEMTIVFRKNWMMSGKSGSDNVIIRQVDLMLFSCKNGLDFVALSQSIKFVISIYKNLKLKADQVQVTLKITSPFGIREC